MTEEDKSKVQLINELKELRRRLSGLEETTDNVTGLYSKDYFLDLAECEFIRSRRFQRPLSVVFISICNFNQIKSENGSNVYDQILAEVARRCKSKVRDLDFFGRYGENRLVLLLPEANASAVKNICERLQQIVSASSISTDAGNVDIKLCMGGTEVSEDTSTLQEFLTEGEKILHSAEQDKGNSCIIIK